MTDQPKPFASRATSYDVARLAGVSQSAVSRCFKPGASVSKKMRGRVMAAADQLQYRPNAIARGLITQRSNLVAVLVSSQMNFYYPEVLFQLTDRFSKKGLRVLLFTINEETDVADSLDQIWQYQADGVISASYLSVQQHKFLEERGIPTISFNRYFENYATNSIWCDHGVAVEEMVNHLIGFGHKRIALLQGPDYSMVSDARMRLVREAAKSQGAHIVCEARGTYRYESAAAATQLLMANKPKPTTIIAANDMMAMGAIDELRNVMGLRVPADVSVAGFDGIGAAQFASYEVSTSRQPISRMADAAVSMLWDRIEKPGISAERRVLMGSFVQGTSTGPAPNS
ncbi:MAG: LacI family DNA-binding transcriptional regulator [Pseudomonadota bacterium]